jgi:uncharacterized protein (DUF4415 family)
MAAARPKAEKPLKDVVTVRLDAQLSADMEALRERDGIPFSEQIRRALHMFLESKGIRRKRKGA